MIRQIFTLLLNKYRMVNRQLFTLQTSIYSTTITPPRRIKMEQIVEMILEMCPTTVVPFFTATAEGS